MLNSYSEFKSECNCGQVDEDADPDESNLETDQGIVEGIDTVQADILEQQEIYLSCQLRKKVDEANGQNKTLLFTREIPTKSMEIQGEPFKKRNGEDIRWLRFELYKV